MASPMPLLPPVTSAFLPFNPKSIVASVDDAPDGAACRYARRQATSLTLHFGPIARALERCGSAIDGRLVVIFADQHQPDRQALPRSEDHTPELQPPDHPLSPL